MATSTQFSKAFSWNVVMLCLISASAYGSTGGIDTPAGVPTLPLAAEGQTCLTLTATDANATPPTTAGVGVQCPLTTTGNIGIGLGAASPQSSLDIQLPTNSAGAITQAGLHIYTGFINYWPTATTANKGGNLWVGGVPPLGWGDFVYDGGTDAQYDFVNSGKSSNGATVFTWSGDGTVSNPETSLLYIGNNGNIGIGNFNIVNAANALTPPASNLHIIGGGNNVVNNAITAPGTALQIETPGTGIHQQSMINLVTYGDRNTLGSGNTDLGWTIFARGNAFDTNLVGVDSPNSFGISYWNGTSWNEHLRILPNGNVGIGTSTPSSTLDVSGTIEMNNVAGPYLGSGGTIQLNDNNAAPVSTAVINPNGLGLFAGAALPINNPTPIVLASPGGGTLQTFVYPGGITLQTYAGDRNVNITGTGISVHQVNTQTNASTVVSWIDQNGDAQFNGTVTCTGGCNSGSDERLKKDIRPLVLNGLDTVQKLKPVTFAWKAPKSDSMKGEQFGFIAQDMQKVLPEVVVVGNDKDKTLSLKYDALIPVLTKALQEQQSEIQQLQAEIKALKVDQ